MRLFQAGEPFPRLRSFYDFKARTGFGGADLENEVLFCYLINVRLLLWHDAWMPKV